MILNNHFPLSGMDEKSIGYFIFNKMFTSEYLDQSAKRSEREGGKEDIGNKGAEKSNPEL